MTKNGNKPVKRVINLNGNNAKKEGPNNRTIDEMDLLKEDLYVPPRPLSKELSRKNKRA
jgi:hypothetical protein